MRAFREDMMPHLWVIFALYLRAQLSQILYEPPYQCSPKHPIELIQMVYCVRNDIVEAIGVLDKLDLIRNVVFLFIVHVSQCPGGRDCAEH